ncbi:MULTISPECIES: alpha/beta fold hydrolase [unclassified Bacillus (in: firmicutes)]|uniref:alpha/beta fold hydrolase n=1 Tax=unclassified Bacillus (in: firmicutes) TaxID=185979 RepID=UPI001BEC48B3|nr:MULTISPECIES: alpha/beta hydrolase [unclassified Bacillus (in: firmicutes)]MBT2618053.1 alpha/beta fold hydrolase [Bacillus sp. ISL-78]MBT2630126.1 alpha/beta fold hydrolase [Bacillus sp. ISL-101]MBT2718691.1 alpha/beta fold hydrolase [Bacillus sp. ISL-57]
MKIEKYKVETPKGTLQYNISGKGKPNIVLINGGSGPMEGWMKILPVISESASVFSYNRLGVAGSDKPKENQDGISIVTTLREALTIVGFEPPYLVVGHSLGGLYANLFARLYPNEVAGIVFLESSTTKDISLNEYQGKAVKTINKMFKLFDSLSSHKQYNEVYFVKNTVDQIQQIDTFPEIPVLVITGGQENRMMPEEIRKKRLENQMELLSLSKSSKHIVAEKSGHFPQLTEPAIVIDTIKDCAEQLNEANHN